MPDLLGLLVLLLGTFTVVLGTLAVAFRLGLASFCRQFDRVVLQKVRGLCVDGTGALVCVRGSKAGFVSGCVKIHLYCFYPGGNRAPALRVGRPELELPLEPLSPPGSSGSRWRPASSGPA